MLQDKLKNYQIILASGSPRRQELLKNLGLEFEVKALDIEETFPPSLKHAEIAIYLSELKANAFEFSGLHENSLVITSDTIVWLNDEILPKPKDRKDAFQILRKLSGKTHDVITGVTISTKQKLHSFSSTTKVHFKELTDEEISYYIKHYKPFDKAGAYGIQEWIGYIGIEGIEGSYFNVVGLPVQKLYSELISFVQ